MSSLSNILLDKEILLESGTNELEVLVFKVSTYTFGINVAKVREVLPTAEITSLPKAHPSIRGVFKLRNQVIPCVSLLDHLGITASSDQSESTMILTDLNQQQTAFLVDEVERIHRLSWQNILAVPNLDDLANTPVTALARCQERLIVMLDFEMILDDVTEQFFRTDEVANPMGLPREKLHLLLAEDSPTVRQAITNTLSASGYRNQTFFENGAEAWEWISKRIEATGRAEDVGDLLICDVEMPQMDGFHLTKQIKEHPLLRQIPVLLYSSIITPDNRKKGNAVGANAQVAKPELIEVVRLADELIVAAQQAGRAEALKEITESAAPGSEAATPAASAVPQAAKIEETASVQAPQSAPAEVPAAAVAPAPVKTPNQEETTSSVAGPLVDQCEPEPPTVPAAELLSRPVPFHYDGTATPPPPRNVDASLWRTFHRELAERSRTLEDLLRQVSPQERRDEPARQMARVLHTIKSASMVVPVSQVTSCTHLAESLVEKWQHAGGACPKESLESYLGWVKAIVSATEQVQPILDHAPALESEMKAYLA